MSPEGVGRTVYGNSNALKELEAVFSNESRNFAQLANLEVLSSPRFFANFEFEIIRFCDRLDRDGTGMVTLKWNYYTSEVE